MHADLHHTQLVHTPLAHFHAGMANALACIQYMSHSTRSWLLSINCPPCMSQPPLVQNFAEHSRELSRVSKVPFSCVSFWQGLCFAVQNRSDSSAQWLDCCYNGLCTGTVGYVFAACSALAWALVRA